MNSPNLQTPDKGWNRTEPRSPFVKTQGMTSSDQPFGTTAGWRAQSGSTLNSHEKTEGTEDEQESESAAVGGSVFLRWLR